MGPVEDAGASRGCKPVKRSSASAARFPDRYFFGPAEPEPILRKNTVLVALWVKLKLGVLMSKGFVETPRWDLLSNLGVVCFSGHGQFESRRQDSEAGRVSGAAGGVPDNLN